MSTSHTSTPTLRSPEELVTFLLNLAPYSDPAHNLASITHRQNLVKLWGIPPGATVLEIGCGQGDFTIPLADAVGPTGRVVAIDPMPGDYGTPPLAQAQAHVKASPVGPQIEFLQAEGSEFLKSTTETFDFVIIAHTAWYFSDPSVLSAILSAAAAPGKTKTLLIAEFALTASRPGGNPPILTALATNALESFRDETSWRNLRCALSPAQITAAAEKEGWRLKGEEKGILTPPNEKYGWRETVMILKRQNFVDDVNALEENDKVKKMLLGMRDALAASVERLEGGMGAIVDMDVWAGRFEVGA
ncbi:S-adenosyl-L-methionine-dependent methyltransferase [Cercophora newfieldiana]|uniref:S-adenosyl-L-methionine-dependent methyltransferase n=1 Tax=Cercophora newfieldiana TaxID=92897 RepID=A0AA39YLM1_9PEZI|nr:S-adenosyl-L-methionine-dependent methyltransferase [Cercophora newfieldiana]